MAACKQRCWAACMMDQPTAAGKIKQQQNKKRVVSSASSERPRGVLCRGGRRDVLLPVVLPGNQQEKQRRAALSLFGFASSAQRQKATSEHRQRQRQTHLHTVSDMHSLSLQRFVPVVERRNETSNRRVRGAVYARAESRAMSAGSALAAIGAAARPCGVRTWYSAVVDRTLCLRGRHGCNLGESFRGCVCGVSDSWRIH